MFRNPLLGLAAASLCGWTAGVYAESNRVPIVPSSGPAPAAIVTVAYQEAAPAALPTQPAEPPKALPKVAAAESVPAKQLPPIALESASSGETCHSGIMGGVSLYVLRPFINNNTAFITTTGIGTPNPVNSSTEFDWNYQVAPAVWLGWTSPDGLGFRGRYFYFNHDSNSQNATLTTDDVGTVSIAPPAGLSPTLGGGGGDPRGFVSPGILLNDLRGQDSLTFRSDLRIQTIDGEATFARDWGCISMLLSAGGRYLQMSQSYHASLTNIVDADNSEISQLISGHNFYGGGPTLACQGSWRLANSGLGVFGSARGSFLVGTSRQNSTFSEVIVDPINGNQNNLATNSSRDTLNLPILELEGGLQYDREMGRSRMFVRGACTHHTYFDAGSASSRDGNLSLFGVQLSVGLDY